MIANKHEHCFETWNYFKDDDVRPKINFVVGVKIMFHLFVEKNPFTFPFRLPPPDDLIAKTDRKTDIAGSVIRKHRKFLTLTQSILSPNQSSSFKIIKKNKKSSIIDSRVICVYPQNKTFSNHSINIRRKICL